MLAVIPEKTAEVNDQLWIIKIVRLLAYSETTL